MAATSVAAAYAGGKGKGHAAAAAPKYYFQHTEELRARVLLPAGQLINEI